MEMGDFEMRMFPAEDQETVTGAICKSGDFYKPSAESGPLVYFNANPDLQVALDKVESAGGTIVIPKTQITPEYGYMAVFLDSEGNRVAFHSMG
jgi:predicted enzyme related to lactoylglutathione lyase